LSRVGNSASNLEPLPQSTLERSEWCPCWPKFSFPFPAQRTFDRRPNARGSRVRHESFRLFFIGEQSRDPANCFSSNPVILYCVGTSSPIRASTRSHITQTLGFRWQCLRRGGMDLLLPHLTTFSRPSIILADYLPRMQIFLISPIDDLPGPLTNRRLWEVAAPPCGDGRGFSDNTLHCKAGTDWAHGVHALDLARRPTILSPHSQLSSATELRPTTCRSGHGTEFFNRPPTVLPHRLTQPTAGNISTSSGLDGSPQMSSHRFSPPYFTFFSSRSEKNIESTGKISSNQFPLLTVNRTRRWILEIFGSGPKPVTGYVPVQKSPPRPYRLIRPVGRSPVLYRESDLDVRNDPEACPLEIEKTGNQDPSATTGLLRLTTGPPSRNRLGSSTLPCFKSSSRNNNRQTEEE